MDKDEVLDRIREELSMPFFKGKIEDKEYSEEEYQEFKEKIIKYFDDYVRNVEH